LETGGLQRPSDPYLHSHHHIAESMDARIHNRMPVVLQDDHINAWLDPTVSDPRHLGALLKAPPEEFLDCYPVSRGVNSVKFDEPEYAEKIALDYVGLLQNDPQT
jgi:putative SOS response-associated peptidase YedK